jgi:hypothetical protein
VLVVVEAASFAAALPVLSVVAAPVVDDAAVVVDDAAVVALDTRSAREVELNKAASSSQHKTPATATSRGDDA